MKTIRFVSIFIFVLFVSFAPSLSDASENKPFIPVDVLKTESGITVWFVQDRTVPLLSMKFFFNDVGAAYDPEDKQGLARMVSNTLDEGAGVMSAQAFQKQLSDHSISLSFNSSRDHFSGSLKTLVEYQDKAFDLLRQSLTSPRFDQEAIDRMRNANIARIKSSLGRPDWAAARVFNDTLYQDHPYTKNSGGTLSGLNAITRDDLLDYTQKNFSLNRLHIAVVGDIDRSVLLEKVDQVFGDLPAKSKNNNQKISDLVWPTAQEVKLYGMNGLQQSKVMMAFPGIPLDDTRYYAMKLLSTVLGGSGFGSRLMEEIREKHGLTYGIYSYLSPSAAAQSLQIEASSQNETVAELLSRTVDELKRLQYELIPQEELNAHRDYLIGSMPLSLTSTDKIAGILSYLQMYDLPHNYFDGRAESLRIVTPEDIQKLAKDLLNLNQAVVVLAGGVEQDALKPGDTQLKPFEKVDVLPNVE